MRIGSNINWTGTQVWTTAKLYVVAIVLALLFAGFNSSVTGAQTVAAKEVTQVSTGSDTTCAVVDYWVKCWGSNSSGQLGIGNTNDKFVTSPVKVADNQAAIAADPGVCASKNWFGQCTRYSRQPAPAKPASALAGLTVDKVSVGKNHVCALANARVFCWGDNSSGQLGDRSNKSSSSPVAVDVRTTSVAAVYTKPNPCGGWFQPSCTPRLTQEAQTKSSIAQQEMMDVVAGDNFTCALAADGVVSCWGEGDHGRLGTGAVKDVNYPVHVKATSALSGKKVLKLAKVTASTMCVLAVPEDTENDDDSGNPYCWGYGVGNGAIPTGKGASTEKCSKSSPQAKPSGTSKETYFNASEPVKISDTKVISDIVSNDYVTALGADKQVYYWGMHGYRESTTYTNVTTCSIDPCKAYADSFKLVGYTSTSRTTTQKNSTGGTTKNTNHYSGKATPGTTAKGWSPDYGNNKCKKSKQTHYGFTKTHAFTRIGQLTPTVPPSSSASPKTGVRALSGNVMKGLYCAVNSAGAYCDTNGSSMKEGQTGSGYVEQCTTKTIFFIFKSTTCQPAPTGTQKVSTTNWLGNKTIDSINTGTSGHTCVLANNGIACWGVNNKGQLGVGNTTNRNVPTEVNL